MIERHVYQLVVNAFGRMFWDNELQVHISLKASHKYENINVCNDNNQLNKYPSGPPVDLCLYKISFFFNSFVVKIHVEMLHSFSYEVFGSK